MHPGSRRADYSSTRQTEDMHSRKVRVPATGVRVQLGPGSGDLINVSVSGALMRLDHAVEVGAALPLHIERAGGIDCRVVRCSPTSAPGQPPNVQHWLIAVTFGQLSAEAEKPLRELVAE